MTRTKGERKRRRENKKRIKGREKKGKNEDGNERWRKKLKINKKEEMKDRKE